MTPTLRFRVIRERNALVSMAMSFFALPSKQSPVQGRFKPAHRPISLSTKVAACVRRFETPTAVNHGRTESKKDIAMLFSPLSFLGDPDCLQTQASAFHIHSNLKNVKCEPKANKHFRLL